MAFPDFPFPSEWNSYLSHQQVLKYLQDYASHFDLYKYIQFNSSINSVRPLEGKDNQKLLWEVVVRDADTKESQILLFDAVIVCNGWVYFWMFSELFNNNKFSLTRSEIGLY